MLKTVVLEVAKGYRKEKYNSPLPLIYASIKYLTSSTRLRRGLGELMVSEMAMGSKIFGSCVEGIDVLEELDR